MDEEKMMNLLLSEKKELAVLMNRIESENVIEPDSWKVVNEIGDEAIESLSLLSKQAKMDRIGRLAQRVDQAIEDLKKGRFGICNRCEGSISEDRLMAHPHSQFCLECQKIIDEQS